MRRPRDHLGEPMLPSKRKARVDEEQIQKARKKERSLSCTSPLLSCLTRHSEFSWYEEDLWIEVAKFLDGKDLIRLAVTNRWFYRLIMEDSIWKYACLRDLQVLSPHHVSFKWFQLYASAFDWMRIGAFFIETPSAVLTEKLELPSKLIEIEEDHNRAIQLSGTCILRDVRTGIWIADLQLVRCPVCNLNTCEGRREDEERSDDYIPTKICKICSSLFHKSLESLAFPLLFVYLENGEVLFVTGTMQILDVRHLELFLEESFRNGSWQFEDIGSHRIEKQSNSASGGVFDYKHIHSPCTAGLLNTSGWFADPGDWQPRARISTHAVAVNTNLQPNDGLHVRFQAMRSKGSDGKVVSIRISQQLI